MTDDELDALNATVDPPAGYRWLRASEHVSRSDRWADSPHRILAAVDLELGEAARGWPETFGKPFGWVWPLSPATKTAPAEEMERHGRLMARSGEVELRRPWSLELDAHPAERALLDVVAVLGVETAEGMTWAEIAERIKARYDETFTSEDLAEAHARGYREGAASVAPHARTRGDVLFGPVTVVGVHGGEGDYIRPGMEINILDPDDCVAGIEDRLRLPSRSAVAEAPGVPERRVVEVGFDDQYGEEFEDWRMR